jgi:hypothetical protein
VINVFTLKSRIAAMQQDLLAPLYTMHDEQETVSHDWLLVLTGRAVARHQHYIEELAASKLVAAAFKIVKLLGGADQLQADDFQRFTGYVNDGGLRAMVKMLLAADKEAVFLRELQGLPRHIQANAPAMLTKSAQLHGDFIRGFFRRQYGHARNAPEKLQNNFLLSETFIKRLAALAGQNLAR